jgi:hypothetical protein
VSEVVDDKAVGTRGECGVGLYGGHQHGHSTDGVKDAAGFGGGFKVLPAVLEGHGKSTFS